MLPRLANELDDLLLPYTVDISQFANLTHPELLDHIRRVGVGFLQKAAVASMNEAATAGAYILPALNAPPTRG